MFLIYLALTFFIGWRLSSGVRHAIDGGLGHKSIVTAALFSIPLAWCAGYTAAISTSWIAMQSVALFSDNKPSLVSASWSTLAVLGAISLLNRRARQGLVLTISHDRIPVSVICLVCAIWLMAIGIIFGTASTQDGVISVPQILRGDLYSHIALIRSFSLGYNFPTEVPFFQGESIRYHFLFYFGGGVLEALGAPLDIALNLPSTLGLGSFLSLVAFGAWRLSGSMLAASIAPCLCLFRSSLSWIDWVCSLVQFHAGDASALQGSFFYGMTPYENWGIFSPNVHLNQRHFTFGLSWMLLALFVCLFTSPIPHPQRLSIARPYALMGILVGLGAYWNGAAFLSTLLALTLIALFHRYRAKALLVVIPAAVIGFFVVGLVTYGNVSATPFKPFLRVGFLSSSQEPLAVIMYIAWIFGVLPMVAFFGARRYPHVGWPLFMVGGGVILMVFLFQITEVAPQGHKFVNAGVLVWSILSASVVAFLLTSEKLHIRLGGQLTFVLLTLTGITDLATMIHLGSTKRSISIDNPTIRWIESSTSREVVFLSASRADRPFLMAGRRAYIGPRSLTSDAGYIYGERLAWLKELVQREPAEQVVELRKRGITYVTNDLCPDMHEFFSDPCPAVPEVTALMRNPLLRPVYKSTECMILEVPKS